MMSVSATTALPLVALAGPEPAQDHTLAARIFQARRDHLNPASAHRAAERAVLGRKGSGRAVGVAIGVEQHLVVGAFDGAIARCAIAAEDTNAGIAGRAARTGQARRPTLAPRTGQALDLVGRQRPLYRRV